MRDRRPFQPDDLAELDQRLLSRAHAVVALQEVHAGNRHPDVIAMRHDVDDNPHALETALMMAEWEADRGYRSTFFLLHSASYWQQPRFPEHVQRLALHGHEIGIHADALADALQTGRDPAETLADALKRLRGLGVTVRGVAGHGNDLCRTLGFANDEQFVECARPKSGLPRRKLNLGGQTVTIDPRPLAEFGLVYEAIRLGCGYRQSDSGGHWLFPFDESVAHFEAARAGSAAGAAVGQTHLLIHPDWWNQAFKPRRQQ